MSHNSICRTREGTWGGGGHLSPWRHGEGRRFKRVHCRQFSYQVSQLNSRKSASRRFCHMPTISKGGTGVAKTTAAKLIADVLLPRFNGLNLGVQHVGLCGGLGGGGPLTLWQHV